MFSSAKLTSLHPPCYIALLPLSKHSLSQLPQLLERASGREKYLERAAREMKLRGRKGDAQPALAQLDADAGWSPEQEAQVEAEFLAAVAGGSARAAHS